MEGLCKLRVRESEKLKTVLGIVQHGDSPEESWTWLSQIEDNGEKKYRAAELQIRNFEGRTEIMRETAWSRIRRQKQREQRILGDCWQWKANGQCSKGDNCSCRHDMNKRAKPTQPNRSPRSSTRQNEKNASRTRSPRGRSPSGRMSRLSCKDYLKGTCTNPFCEKWHPPECLFFKSEEGCRFGEKCSYAHRQVEELPSKRSQKNGDKSAVATRQLVYVFKIWSRRSLHRSCGRAHTYWSHSDVFDSLKPCYVMLTFETRTHLGMICPVILISVTPLLQNLRTGLRRRRNGKSEVPGKQRGSWPKVCQIEWRDILLTFGDLVSACAINP